MRKKSAQLFLRSPRSTDRLVPAVVWERDDRMSGPGNRRDGRAVGGSLAVKSVDIARRRAAPVAAERRQPSLRALCRALCAARLSMTTTSPGRRCRTRCRRTHATKRTVFMAPHDVARVSQRSTRMAPTSVTLSPSSSAGVRPAPSRAATRHATGPSRDGRRIRRGRPAAAVYPLDPLAERRAGSRDGGTIFFGLVDDQRRANLIERLRVGSL